jgi:hypothetical protein
MPTARILFALFLTAAVFSVAHGEQPQERTFVALPGNLNKCDDLLRLEKELEKGISPTNVRLLIDKANTIGWLKGFFTARNFFDETTDGNITKGSTPSEWMHKVFNFCRAHPSATLSEGALGLAFFLGQKKN